MAGDGSSGRAATLWVTLEKIGQQASWLILFLVMAPILGPRPYGQVALVMVFIGLCELLLVDATVEGLVSLGRDSRPHLRTALLAAVGLGAAVGLAALLGAGLLGRLFDDPELASMMRVMSVLPLVSALTAGPISRLRQQLAFRALAMRSLLGITVGGAVAVVLALRGAGAWALVVQILVQRTVELLVLWIVEPSAIALGWSRSCWRDMAPFMRAVIAARTMHWASGQGPRLIIGYVLGPAALGIFTLAARASDAVIQVLVQPRTIVARIELMAVRDDPPAFQAGLRQVIRDIALVAFPAACGAAAIMPGLFALALDARWQPGVPTTQLMLLTAIPFAGYYACTAGLLAAGRADLEARISLWQSLADLAVTAAAAPFGVTAVAAGMLARLVAMLPLALRNLARAVPIRPVATLAPAAGIAALGLAMGAAVTATGRLVPLPGPAAAQLLLLIGEGVVLYAIGLACLGADLVRATVRRLKGALRRGS